MHFQDFTRQACPITPRPSRKTRCLSSIPARLSDSRCYCTRRRKFPSIAAASPSIVAITAGILAKAKLYAVLCTMYSGLYSSFTQYFLVVDKVTLNDSDTPFFGQKSGKKCPPGKHFRTSTIFYSARCTLHSVLAFVFHSVLRTQHSGLSFRKIFPYLRRYPPFLAETSRVYCGKSRQERSMTIELRGNRCSCCAMLRKPSAANVEGKVGDGSPIRRRRR
jgi:hypothetical protein